MQSTSARFSGMWGFTVVWLGQLVSLLATSMTQFGLTIFVYEKAGGIIMSAWGGTRRKVHGVLFGHVLDGVLGMMLIGLGRDLPLWVTGAFLGWMLIPWINGSNQAIWQAKVAPDVQGRVFAARRLIAWFTQPVAPLLAGPLADYVLEPGMRAGGSLTGLFGGLAGVGPGAGMALLLIGMGLLSSVVGAVGYLFPAVRDAERILPDHDAAPVSATLPA